MGNEPTESPKSSNIRFYYKGYSIQITVRDENEKIFPLLKKMMKIADYAEANNCQPSWNPETNKAVSATKTPTQPLKSTTRSQTRCSTCGGPMEFKKGTGKTGKSWKAYFCVNKCGAEPSWIG